MREREIRGGEGGREREREADRKEADSERGQAGVANLTSSRFDQMRPVWLAAGQEDCGGWRRAEFYDSFEQHADRLSVPSPPADSDPGD
jgi:hypothetical protein